MMDIERIRVSEVKKAEEKSKETEQERLLRFIQTTSFNALMNGATPYDD